jgi:hypothetical protein
MNNETRKKAEDELSEALGALDKMITTYPQGGRGGGKSNLHENWTIVRGKIINAKSLLQNEEEEGGEVVLCNHEISCPSCTVIFSWKGICDKPKECICGQKLIWPKEKEGEG